MRHVKYVGLSHQRIITATDWRMVGLHGETVVWNAQNGFSVPLDRLTEDQIRKAIEPDASFIITDDQPVHHTTDMVPAEADQAAQNPGPAITLDDTTDDVSTDVSGSSKDHR